MCELSAAEGLTLNGGRLAAVRTHDRPGLLASPTVPSRFPLPSWLVIPLEVLLLWGICRSERFWAHRQGQR